MGRSILFRSRSTARLADAQNMSRHDSFYSSSEQKLADSFLSNGYVKGKVENSQGLNEIRAWIADFLSERKGIKPKRDLGVFLDKIHLQVEVEELNDLRVAVHSGINSQEWFRPTYFSLGKSLIEGLVGNELAMQNKVNVSVQMPQDDSSTLGIHSDSFSGETPFQVVLWVPLVDVHDTKAMYLLPPKYNRSFLPNFKSTWERGGVQSVHEEVGDHLQWIEVKYGEVLVFSPNLLHGNVVNQTEETRWSLNCRFTGLFTPYASSEKGLGGFYLPITTRITSRIGMNYKQPEGFA